MDLDSQRRAEPPQTGKQKTRTGQNSLTKNTMGTSTCKCVSKIKRKEFKFTKHLLCARH